ncbi:uncharacterized protein BDCG_06549 [Blastomyces dermatitidis ER-3]|uniref:C2H2-type domain-containing protein n=2 Tax=Ajellomyces dermatitidis TaxID=5039 RepID=F2TAP6_AJEDA|nr:uncharacterized protein BDCG_06549 [Blastomyces dermatitidis ER-3]EEQ91429.1 hypothetical protein BDCG_06549 [Blastomyces dermatitidis ER-3]EGE80309.1 hypothetical protein BDDG_03250 [Blastomyces dermatitidis ATCC 18188]
MAHSRKHQQPQYTSVSRELPITGYPNPYLTESVTAQYHTPRSQYPLPTSVAPAMSYSSSTDSNSSTRTASSMISTSSGHQQQTAYYSSHYPTTSAGFTDPIYQQQQQQQQRQASASYTTSPEYVLVTEEAATTPSRPARAAGLERSGSRYVCMFPRCESSFSRSADLSRHYPTVHFPDSVRLDCPKPRCSRKGEQGFTRQDHLNEHLRQYHKEPVTKRRSSKSSSQRPETYR